MDNLKRIVLILGNGFDLDRGLDTSYKAFAESEYCPKDYPAPIIRHLNNKLRNQLEFVRWYDLENELYNYAKHPAKTDVLSEAERQYLLEHSDYQLYNKYHFNMRDELFSRLLNDGWIRLRPNLSCPYRDDLVFSFQKRDSIALNHIKRSLCEYIKTQNNKGQKKDTVSNCILRTMENIAKQGSQVQVFSFNYTTLPELNNLDIYYMHGTCEGGDVIIGTRDDQTIEEDYDFLMKSMADNYSPPKLVPALDEADEIIVFGHSLGVNDRQYFESALKQLVSNPTRAKKKLIIITRDSKSVREVKRSLNRLTDSHLSELFCNNQPIIIRTANIDKDQNLLYDFLIDHGTDKHIAQEVVGKIAKSCAS